MYIYMTILMLTNIHTCPIHSNLNLRKFCLTIIDRYIWNNIPQPIKEKQMFKKPLSHCYLNQY